jgi:hypothetical protein
MLDEQQFFISVAMLSMLFDYIDHMLVMNLMSVLA